MGLFKKTKHVQVRQPHISDDNDAYLFRRSRTMTGSLSDSVKAVVQDKADLQSERIKHHSLRRKQRHLVFFLLATLLLAAGIVQLLNQFMSSVAVQSISNVPDVTRMSYQREINQYLSSHPDERFYFSLRKAALVQAVQQKFPEVKDVVLAAQPWLQTAHATVSLRQPIASWAIGSTKYYIDDHGVAFQHNFGAEPALTVEDNTGIDPSSTGAVASERMIYYIGRLVALLKQSGYAISQVQLPPVTSREVDVKLVGEGYSIKTDLDRDPAGQVMDIVNAVKYLQSKNITPSYADVRVSSRLYYK